MEAGTTTVTFTVTDMEQVRGAGRLAALAVIEIELDGIALTVHGVRVVRRNDRITIEAPQYRNPNTGQWLPALILPDELGIAIAREVQRILRAPAGLHRSMPDLGQAPRERTLR